MTIWTRKFWKNAVTGMVKTFAQAVLAFFGTDLIGVVDADWVEAANIGGFAAIIYLLMQLAYPSPQSQEEFGLRDSEAGL